MQRFTFTVFTPTFNRAGTLPRVYKSLVSQTFRDFEWLVVDDGSDDGTEDLIRRWAVEATFRVRYTWQGNQGKHIAFNNAVRNAYGRLFLVADSDDSFVPEALERFYLHWVRIPDAERSRYVGVTALCNDEAGSVVGDRFPFDPTDSDNLEISHRYKVRGEKWGFHRTDVLREFPFPQVEGVKFVPEGIIWNAIARKYKTRFINEVLRTYHNDRTDQLTKRDPRTVAAVRVFYAVPLNEELDFFIQDPIGFGRVALHYVRFSLLAGESLNGQLGRLRRRGARLLWFAALIPGALVAAADFVRARLACPR